MRTINHIIGNTKRVRLTVFLGAAVLLASACGPLADDGEQATADIATADGYDATADGGDAAAEGAEAIDDGGDSANQAEAVDDSANADDTGGDDGAEPAPLDDAGGGGSSVVAGSGDAVAPPECDAGSPSAYSPTAPADVAEIETNQIVSGTIEEFTVDNWQIKLCAGQVVFMDSLRQCQGDDDLRWQLIVPDGDQAFSLNNLINLIGNCSGDTGPIEIPETGLYTIEVFYKGADDRTGEYKFEVLNVASPDVFEIAVGQQVEPGAPAAGAGVLEFAGSRDRYQVDLEAGQRIFFEGNESCQGDEDLRWRLIVPDGDEAFGLNNLINLIGNCGGDTDPIEIPESGTYTVEVYYTDDVDSTASSYSFRLRDASGG
ncbi:MAG: hypothetical protein AAGD35_01535 [Actinomycetota bacterium]